MKTLQPTTTELVSIKYSVTERGTYKRCRRMWDYQSLTHQGLTNRIPTTALQAGTIHHKVMDLWCRAIIAGDDSFDAIAAVDTVSAEIVHDIANRYKEEVGMKVNLRELEPTVEAIEFERSMIRNYVNYWHSPIQSEFELIQPEQTIVIPVCEAPCSVCDGSGRLTSPSTAVDCHACNGYGRVQLELEGTLDAVARYNNSYYVVERKTYDKRPNLDYLRFFDQGTAYVWMLTQLNIGPVAGIAYDGAWRRHKPSPRNTIDDLFLRTLLLRTEYEIEHYHEQLVNELRDMNATTPDKVYPNRQWQGCYDCGYRRLCDAQTLGEDVEYIRERHYTLRELTPAYQLPPEIDE